MDFKWLVAYRPPRSAFPENQFVGIGKVFFLHSDIEYFQAHLQRVMAYLMHKGAPMRCEDTFRKFGDQFAASFGAERRRKDSQYDYLFVFVVIFVTTTTCVVLLNTGPGTQVEKQPSDLFPTRIDEDTNEKSIQNAAKQLVRKPRGKGREEQILPPQKVGDMEVRAEARADARNSARYRMLSANKAAVERGKVLNNFIREERERAILPTVRHQTMPGTRRPPNKLRRGGP